MNFQFDVIYISALMWRIKSKRTLVLICHVSLVHSSLKLCCYRLLTERDHLRTTLSAETSGANGNTTAALRSSLHQALQQNVELKHRLSTIHSTSDLSDITSVNSETNVSRYSLSSRRSLAFRDVEVVTSLKVAEAANYEHQFLQTLALILLTWFGSVSTIYISSKIHKFEKIYISYLVVPCFQPC